MSTMRLRAAARREQLLDAAKRLVGERGFHGVSLEAVARAAGVTRPIVYSHFGDLRRLFEALIDRELARALQQLDGVLPAALDPHAPGAQLLAALRGYLDVVAADPVTWRLVLMPPEGAPEVLRDRIASGRLIVLGRLTELLAPGLGRPSSPDPELTARTLSAVADEAARLVLTDPAAYSVDRICRHAAWILDVEEAEIR